MLFNSVEFALFLPAVFAIHWACGGRLFLQNLAIVSASAVFYGWWDWRFLSLIAFTAGWSWAAGLVELRRIRLGLPPSRAVLASSLAVNLGILAAFKYFGFFAAEAAALLSSLGFRVHAPELSIVLPVGISFYTFQALGYTIDVYRRQIAPERSPLVFFAYISFFPQLVAGPIERASSLLPQFAAPRRFDCAFAVSGLRLALWGFFKKCVVADSCAAVADAMLAPGASSGALAVWVGILAFAFQIYGDFSGYSDIAVGVARLFGVSLMRNFRLPYFADGVADFWRRWHISLTTWFRDYLYIPLGGGRCSRAKRLRNVFAVFLASGLWHGANWTFVAWGAYHAALFIPSVLWPRRRAPDAPEPSFASVAAKRIGIFLLVLFGWTFFRAPDMDSAWRWLGAMAGVGAPWCAVKFPRETVPALVSVAAMMALEWIGRNGEGGLAVLPRRTLLRWLVYWLVAWAIVFYAPGSDSFVYFRF